jgi:serine/threonine-protein kinase HipA
MARRRANIPLNVFLNGKLVGRLSRQTSGAIDFHYDKSWLEWENALPVSLSLPLREDRYAGRPVIEVFDNLLPDSNEIRHRLAARVKAESDDAYSLLAAIGRDCVGALQFLPDGADPGPAGRIEGRRLTNEAIARILGDLTRTPLGLTAGEEFRISIAGAQEKTALLFWNGQWHIPHDSTATTHILKPQIGERGDLDLSQSVENEHLCMKLTVALGLPAAHTDIVAFAGKRVLVIERFDRRWTGDHRLLRLPQEDCCQALSFPATSKYESDGGPGIIDILKLLKGSDDPEHDLRVFLKAQIVFWLLGAPDGQAKNFSIHLSPGGRFHMTPLYDVVSAQPNVDRGQIQRNKMKFAMAVGKNRHYAINSIVPRHFIQTGEAAGIPDNLTQGIMEELLVQAPKVIEQTWADLPSPFPEQIAESIRNGILRRLTQIEQLTAGG